MGSPRWGTLGWKKLDSLKAVDRAKADLLKEAGSQTSGSFLTGLVAFLVA